ncbi:MAG: hypothetical protein IPQ19_11000 [Bacteroidetes bacterium]|nr:hypothetical protein [Bacteroidota bacterium]
MLIHTQNKRHCMVVSEITSNNNETLYKCIWHNENNDHKDKIYAEELLSKCPSKTSMIKIRRSISNASSTHDEEGFKR